MSSQVDAPDTEVQVETITGTQSSELKEMILNTKDLPAMPHVASKVLDLSSDPNTSAAQLQSVIADDQAMTARILKIANSAMYACSRKIKTLTEAIVMLGFNSIRSLVITSAARNVYLSNSQRMGLKERLLWEHSVGSAFACKLLAKKKYPGLAEEAFLTGLMHDIGKLVLNLHASEQFDEIVQIVYNESRSFAETEVELLGFDHAEVGALLVNKWKLSPLMEEVIAHHHDESKFSAENPLLCYLDLANGMCRKIGIGFVQDENYDLVASPANEFLGVTAEDFESVGTELQATLESEMEIFV